MQHILIPTDFSDNAWNATSYALRFFKNQEVSFHFLHVDVTMQINADANLHSFGISAKKEISEELKSKMTEWVNRVQKCCPNAKHHFNSAILKTTFIEGVRFYIKEHAISFVVMGTKGASGLKEMTIGSKTGSVITRVRTPILVIPEEASFKIPLNIGFPTDFNLTYNNKVIETLITVAEEHNSTVRVLYAKQSPKSLNSFQNSNKELLKHMLHTSNSFHETEDQNLEHAIQSFVTSLKVDFIAMVAKNLNFYQRILFKPQVEKISYHINIPFLILHE